MRIIDDLSHSGINENLRKVADLPEDYGKRPMSTFEWGLVLAFIVLIVIVVFRVIG